MKPSRFKEPTPEITVAERQGRDLNPGSRFLKPLHTSGYQLPSISGLVVLSASHHHAGMEQVLCYTFIL